MRKTKKCCDCKKRKLIKYFGLMYNGSDRRRSYCKKCANLRMKKARREHPERHWKYRYGLSQNEYNFLLKLQKGVCAICHKPPQANTRCKAFLHVDHRGEEIRGLLCEKCNRGLGQFLDNPLFLRAAALYLLKFSKTGSPLRKYKELVNV